MKKPDQSRNKNWETVRKLPAFVLASILFGTLGYLILIWAFPFFSRAFLGKVDWNMLGGYVSVISLALVAGGLAFALAEYIDKENAKRHEKTKLSYDIYQAIFEKLTASEHEAARRWILSNIPLKKEGEDIAVWYEQIHSRIMRREAGVKDELPEGQMSVKLTLNCFDYIGFIANHYWDMDKDSLDWISPPIAKVWKRIGPYVSQIRILRNASDYYVSAEYIGNRCIQWRKDQGLPEEKYDEKTL